MNPTETRVAGLRDIVAMIDRDICEKVAPLAATRGSVSALRTASLAEEIEQNKDEARVYRRRIARLEAPAP